MLKVDVIFLLVFVPNLFFDLGHFVNLTSGFLLFVLYSSHATNAMS